MADLAESFGRRVRELRTETGMTQSQLAEAIDMSVEWVRRIENGRAAPSFDTVSALAKSLSVRPQDLFADTTLPITNRVVVAMQGLSAAQIEWLLMGARLLQGGAQTPTAGRGGAPIQPRGSVAKRPRKRT